MSGKEAKPLSLNATLRDLALLRVSEVDLSSTLPAPLTPTTGTTDSTLTRSYEFVAEARAAMKLHNKGDVEKAGAMVDSRATTCIKGLLSSHHGLRCARLVASITTGTCGARCPLSPLLPVAPGLPHSPVDITRVVVPTVIPRRGLILTLLSLLSLSALLDGLLFVSFAVIDKAWPHNTGIEYNAILGVVAFAGLAALGAWKDIQGVDVWSQKRLRLAVATSCVLDLAIVALLAKSFNTGSRFPLTHKSITIIFPSFRVLAGLLLLAAFASPRIVYKPVAQDTTENVPTDSSSLCCLRQLASPRYRLQATRANTGPSDLRAVACTNLYPSWSEIWQRIVRLTPYLWPSKSRSLQLLMALCIILILLGRVVNASVPFTLGEIVKIFEGTSQRSVWPVLLFYVLLRFLQGSGGLAALRDCLWTPVMQYSDRQMSQLAFDHLLQLSFNFHIHRNTGQVLRVLDRGAAINHTLEHLIFTIAPTFIDITIALVVFDITFGFLLSAVVFAVLFLYVSASVVLTRWRTKIRRQMNECDIVGCHFSRFRATLKQVKVTRGIASDTLLNYETVKYFSGEDQESRRYQEAVGRYQALESKVIVSLSLLNLVQNFIISTGLLVGSLIVAHRVTAGQAAPSDFIIFITYLAQLYGPLNQIGFMYRTINQTLVDTEKLLQLLNEPTEVEDRDNATTLVVDGGEIEFALNGISFKVPKGSSVALVGESGAGKSTITRLLYRFYDLPEGSGRILIDGQDIRDVTQKSLRAAIGVVPQDCVLFNSSMEYNISYGKFGANLEEIEEAAKSAQIHERIVTFPDGEWFLNFSSIVHSQLTGCEYGFRTLLKNPPILLLDEATSALDSTTEKDIQKALQNLMQGRSSLSIAHRLSTIASADLFVPSLVLYSIDDFHSILVLKDGEIIERGTHAELLALDGAFAAMWADQITASGDVPTPAATTDKILPEEVPEEVEEVPEAVVTGYSAEAEEVSSEVAPENTEPILLEEAAAIEPPTKDHEATVTFPTLAPEPDSATPKLALGGQPLAFPVSDDASLADNAPATPGVTFEPNLTSPTTSPDPEAEPKRKRISSQNFQRLARRISIGTRRQGSTSSIASIIPGLKRDKSGDDASVDSPTTSLAGDKETGKGKKKKDKRKP
ncbi:hypothetical protein C8F01DRAFT_1268287 [Mycena amicta]|nr:hypothetical protein C8F01DRAFT_1268287 [Mycena amicta]